MMNAVREEESAPEPITDSMKRGEPSSEKSTGSPSKTADPETSSPDPEPSDSKSSESSGTKIPKQMIDALIQQESGGDPSATSPVGAEGTAQVMPNTQRDPGYGVEPLKNPRDRQEARRFGKEYLGAMMDEFDNAEEALMAYNWGPANVKEWKRNGADPSEVPDETKGYVRNLLPVAAEAMNMNVESTIMGKQVSNEDRRKAKKAREKMRNEMLKERVMQAEGAMRQAQPNPRPDDTRVRVSSDSPSDPAPAAPEEIPDQSQFDLGGSRSDPPPMPTLGETTLSGRKSAPQIPPEKSTQKETSEGPMDNVPPPPSFRQTNIPPNQTQ